MQLNNNVRMLVIGGTGSIGEIIHSCIPHKCEHFYFTGRKLSNPFNIDSYKNVNYICWDILKDDYCSLLRDTKPNIIIYMAAISSIQLCEDNPDLAHHINYEAIKPLISYLDNNTKIVYASTDRVINSYNDLYNPNNSENPKTIYGKTKLMAEEYINIHHKNSLILRLGKLIPDKSSLFLPEKIYRNLFLFPVSKQYLLPQFSNLLLDQRSKGLTYLMPSCNISYYSFYKRVFPDRLDFIQNNTAMLEEDSALLNKSVYGIMSYNSYSIEKFFTEYL